MNKNAAVQNVEIEVRDWWGTRDGGSGRRAINLEIGDSASLFNIGYTTLQPRAKEHFWSDGADEPTFRVIDRAKIDFQGKGLCTHVNPIRVLNFKGIQTIEDNSDFMKFFD